MWSDEEIEWHEEDEFELLFLNRILGGEESDYSEGDSGGKDIIPLYYSILKYGICKSNCTTDLHQYGKGGS